MASITGRLRGQYAPPCSNDRTVLNLHGAGRISIRNVTIDAFRALNACLVKHRYSTRRADTGAFNCRRITGGSGYSLHAYGIAADLNWSTNPYGRRLVTDMPGAMVRDIKAIRTNNGKTVFRWGGDYSTNKDAMHYEVICPPADLRSGINPRTVPGASTPPSSGGRPVPSTRQQRAGTWRKGDQGAGVHFMQAMINIMIDAGQVKSSKLVVDGFYGDKTVAAVRSVQTFGRAMQQIASGRSSISVDGIAGPQTFNIIKFWVPVALKG